MISEYDDDYYDSGGGGETIPVIAPVAVICDPCSGGNVVCLQTCCHHFQYGGRDGEGRFFCKNVSPIDSSNPPRWQEEDFVLVKKAIDGCQASKESKKRLFLTFELTPCLQMNRQKPGRPRDGHVQPHFHALPQRQPRLR